MIYVPDNMSIRVIGLIQTILTPIIIISTILGIIYLAKSKSKAPQKYIIGSLIIIVPILLKLILTFVKIFIF